MPDFPRTGGGVINVAPTNERGCWCRHCGKELDPGHTGPCPYCGKTGKDCKESALARVGLKASASATHKPQPSSKSITILGILVAIFLAVFCPLILMLPPFSLGINAGILVGFLLVVFLVSWWRRYHIWLFVRWLEGKLGGEKTYR